MFGPSLPVYGVKKTVTTFPLSCESLSTLVLLKEFTTAKPYVSIRSLLYGCWRKVKGSRAAKEFNVDVIGVRE